jgi:hypothetical protein
MRFGLSIVMTGFCLVSALLGQNEERDSRAIAKIKNIRVSKLDDRLPGESFVRWFGKVVGTAQKIDWEVNDCGEQDGSGRQKDFPICVQAHAITLDHVEVSIMIVVGSHRQGLTRKPGVWGIWVEAKPNPSKVLDELNSLPKELRDIRKTRKSK